MGAGWVGLFAAGMYHPDGLKKAAAVFSVLVYDRCKRGV